MNTWTYTLTNEHDISQYHLVEVINNKLINFSNINMLSSFAVRERKRVDITGKPHSPSDSLTVYKAFVHSPLNLAADVHPFHTNTDTL